MRKVALLLAVTAVVGISAVLAVAEQGGSKGGAQSQPAVLKGKVVKVEGVNVTVSVPKSGGKPDEVVVVTDAATKVTIDGKQAKVADLKADMSVTVSPATGTAKSVEAKAAAGRSGGG